MKAHYNKFTLKQKQMIRAGVTEEFQRQSNDMTRRVFKLFCAVLNQEFGFGKKAACKIPAAEAFIPYPQHIGIITISREDFERYYKEITEAEKELKARNNNG